MSWLKRFCLRMKGVSQMSLDRDLQSIQEVRDLVARAKAAQKIYATYTQEQVDQVVSTVAKAMFGHAEKLAKMAHEETGYGKWEDKTIKNQVASQFLHDYIKPMKTVGIINEIPEKGIVEIGVPVGVVAGLVPSTNPTSTAIYKSMICLKSGNAIILSPHPAAVKSILETVRLINETCQSLGLPEGLVSAISLPTMEATDALMKHKDVSCVLATGGSAMVKAAYSSGTPALGVGPGNVPAFIEKTADIPKAVKHIIESKTFDNGVICASEQAVVVEREIAEAVRAEFIKQGCYFLNEDQKKKFEKIIAKPNGALNAAIVGKSAYVLGQMAGVDISQSVKVILADETGVGSKHPFSKEKLSPLLGFYVEEGWEAACEKCIDILEFEGKGHSLAIHTKNDAIVREFALKKPVSRILVNTPAALGGVGASTNIAPAFTLGCGAVGGSATSDNVTPLHLIDIRRVAYGAREVNEIISTQQHSQEEVELEKIIKRVIEQMNK